MPEREYDFTDGGDHRGGFFDGVVFSGVFREIDFSFANFNGCRLGGTFVECSFLGATFTGVTFTGTFINCTGLPSYVYVLTDED